MSDKQFTPSEISRMKCPASLEGGLLTLEDGTTLNLESLVRQRDNLLEAREYAEEVQRIRTERLGVAVEDLHDQLDTSGALDGVTSAVQALIYRVRAEYALISGQPDAAASEANWRAKVEEAQAHAVHAVNDHFVQGELAPIEADVPVFMDYVTRSGNVLLRTRTVCDSMGRALEEYVDRQPLLPDRIFTQGATLDDADEVDYAFCRRPLMIPGADMQELELKGARGTGAMTAAMFRVIVDRCTPADGNALTVEFIQHGIADPTCMSQFLYEKLQSIEEGMEQAVAQGQEGDAGFDLERAVIGKLMDDSPWTLHPDHGICSALKWSIEALDRAATPSPKG